MRHSYTFIVIMTILASLMLGVHHAPIRAQQQDSARLLRASYTADNQLVLQIETAPNVTLREASLRVNSIQTPLTLTEQALEVEQWVLLDAGATMRDAYRLLTDDLRRFTQALVPQLRFAGIQFGARVTRLDPTADAQQIADWLDTYRVQPVAPSCVFDALAQLPDDTQAPEVIRRVLVIAGIPTSPNPTCTAPRTTTMPVDVILIGDDAQSIYRDLARSSGGSVSVGTIGTLSQRFQTYTDELRASHFYLAITPIQQAFTQGDLVLTLSNGEIITAVVQPAGELVPTATPTSTPTATMTATPTHTPTATLTVSATATRTPDATQTPTSQATVTVQASIVEASPIPTGVPILPEPLTPAPRLTNAQLILIGASMAVVVVLFAMAYLLGWFRRVPRSPVAEEQIGEITLYNTQDLLEMEQTEIVTLREIASRTGDTHVANLINDRDDIIYEIHRPVATLGRRIGSDILVAGDRQISRDHARFITDDAGIVRIVRITNNPILINGLPMDKQSELSAGDVVQLSPNLQVRFTYSDGEANS